MDRVSFILKNISGKILDVGFAACSLHNRITEKFPRKSVFGIDTESVPSSPNYKRTSAEKIPFPDNFFDSIVAGELLEHLKKPELFVREANRLLKKNGVLVATTPNRNSLINRFSHAYQTPIHFSLFSISELNRLLEKNGFGIEKEFCLPYTEESSPGSRNRGLYFFRKILHLALPRSLQEEIVVLARKKGEPQ